MISHRENVPGRALGSFLGQMKVFSEEDPVSSVMSPTHSSSPPLICPPVTPLCSSLLSLHHFLFMSSSPSIQPLSPLAWPSGSLPVGVCLLGPIPWAVRYTGLISENTSGKDTEWIFHDVKELL